MTSGGGPGGRRRRPVQRAEAGTRVAGGGTGSGCTRTGVIGAGKPSTSRIAGSAASAIAA